MSDYMFMLESRLSADQNRVLEHVQAAAGAAGVNLFLTGGGMRDMLGGFRIRDLDFSVEGHALKVAQTLEEQGARTLAVDENRSSTELVFASGVTAQVAMSRTERYAKTGAKPQVTPATIQDDLRGRDFTVNAMALSLNRASRGLLLDPPTAWPTWAGTRCAARIRTCSTTTRRGCSGWFACGSGCRSP